MEELTRLIREDMKPALGVTEPGAIAFATARAKAEIVGEVLRVDVALNSGMYIPVVYQAQMRMGISRRQPWV